MLRSVLAVATVALLAGCQTTDTERALIGGAAGAAGAQALGGDTGTTIAAGLGGAAAGASCDDLGVC
jgi:hypothetical protein